MKIIIPTTITDAMLVSSDVAETDYTAWSSGTTYATGNRCIVTTPDIHKIYESIVDTNLNHDPVIDCALAIPLWWKIVSSTNRWKAFDGIIGSQVSQANLISYSLTPGMIEAIAFLNLDATSITITVTDPIEGPVYNTTIPLLMTDTLGISLIYDWYSYFFGTAPKTTDVVKFDIPPYPSATITIAISNPGLTAKVGGIIVGLKGDLGITKYAIQLSIADYSTKAADVDGNFTITEKAYSKRMSLSFTLPNSKIDEVSRMFALYRATALVWIADEDYASMIVYGFYKNFSIVVPGAIRSDCEIEIEGLT